MKRKAIFKIEKVAKPLSQNCRKFKDKKLRQRISIKLIRPTLNDIFNEYLLYPRQGPIKKKYYKPIGLKETKTAKQRIKLWQIFENYKGKFTR